MSSEYSHDDGDEIELASPLDAMRLMPDAESPDAEEEELFIQHLDQHAKHDGSSEKLIGLGEGVSLIVGLMIGSGIFASPGVVLQNTGSPGLSLLIWVLGGMLAMTGALCYIELGCAIPESGGEFAYLKAAYGDAVGFLFTWNCALVAKPASCSIIAVVFAEYLCRALVPESGGQVSPWAARGVAWACLLVICAINVINASMGIKVQKWTTAAKLAVIAVITVIGLARLATGSTDNFRNFWANTKLEPGAMATATVAALWAYDGWNNLNYVAGEMASPTRDLPRAICMYLSMPLVIGCYCLLNVAYFAALPLADIAGSSTVGLAFGSHVAGRMGAGAVALCVAVSAFGALNASMIGGSRLTQVAGQDGLLPKSLGHIDPRRGTPVTAIMFQGILSAALASLGDFTVLVAFFSFGMWIYYCLTVVGMLVLRVRQPALRRPIKVPGVLAVVFAVIGLAILTNLAIDRPKECLACLVFQLIGAVVYVARRNTLVAT